MSATLIRRLLSMTSAAALAIAITGLAAPAATAEAPPTLTVDPVSDLVSGGSFTPGSDVSLWLNGVLVADSFTQIDPQCGDCGFFFQNPEVDIAIGDTVTVTAGVTVTYVVAPLVITSVSAAAIHGESAPDGATVVVTRDDDEATLEAQVVAGDWAVDLTPWQLGVGNAGTVVQTDEAGNSTSLAWSVPAFTADPGQDHVSGWGFGRPVTVTIGGVSWTGDRIEYEGDSFNVYFGPGPGSTEPDIVPGTTVTVTGPYASKSLTVVDLGLTGWDVAQNTLWGTTDDPDPNHALFLWVSRPDADTNLTVFADGGVWLADLGADGSGYELRINDRLEIAQVDADGDETQVHRVVAGPRFTVGLEVQEVVGLDWPLGQDVVLTVERAGTSVFSATTSPTAATEAYGGWLMTGEGGRVYFDLTKGPIQTVPGDVLTMSSGSVVKTQVIPSLTVDLPDYAADSVSGTADLPEDSFLTLSADTFWNGPPMHGLGSGGDWSWAFTTDQGTPDESTEYDITESSMPFVFATDADGDMTESHAPVPDVRVDPMADRVWASDFAGPTTLTITSGTTTYTGSADPTNVLTRGSWNLDMWVERTGNLPRPAVSLYDLAGVFDIRGGDHISVTDGVSTRELVVADITVDTANASTDVMSGHATQPLTLHMGDGEGGYWGYGVTPVDGQWSYWFEPGVFPNPPDGIPAGMHLQAVDGGTVVRVTATATPIEPSELVPTVQALHLKASTERALLATLQSAQRSYDRSKVKAGNASMEAFIIQVTKLSPKTIPTAAANQLVADARAVIAAHSG
ncbi:FIMAH domain-containing protein [Longivirga aurantiaca]|uniref:FIMAH domain-containing protein n=1 Tax=Longivirga aurantiaca TaxID=1837743 RepID=A0ABW1SW16_9ACTN